MLFVPARLCDGCGGFVCRDRFLDRLEEPIRRTIAAHSLSGPPPRGALFVLPLAPPPFGTPCFLASFVMPPSSPSPADSLADSLADATASAGSASDAAAVPDVIDEIGDTPLLRLRGAGDLPDDVALYAKAEHINPGGSVKDRPALQMVREGRRSGAFRSGQTLIDATSGNTGIAYAMIGAALGFEVALALPENASEARKRILRAHGAELVLTDPMAGTDGAQQRVKELVADAPDRYFYPDQYNNDANWKAHYSGTGAEILEQTDGAVTHFVTGLGTSGTFMGVARRLQEEGAGVHCTAMQPDTAMHALEGLKHMETAQVPGIYDPDAADAHVTCSTEEAVAMTRRLARTEGLLVGPSAGANVATALRVARTLEQGTVVTILCDTGTRYLDDSFWTGDAS
jgi:cysteine synthase B